MARLFNSSSTQFCLTGNAPATATPFTMACWFNPGTTTGAIRSLMSINTSGSNDNVWLLGIDTTDHVFARARTTTQDAGTTSSTVTASVWQHACGTFVSSTNRTAYLNAANPGTGTVSKIPAGTNQFFIGRSASTASLMDGAIAEAAVWNLALSVADITMLAGFCNPLLVKPNNIVGYWPLMGRGTVEPDIWRNRYELMLSGGPTVTGHVPIINRD